MIDMKRIAAENIAQHISFVLIGIIIFLIIRRVNSKAKAKNEITIIRLFEICQALFSHKREFKITISSSETKPWARGKNLFMLQRKTELIRVKTVSSRKIMLDIILICLIAFNKHSFPYRIPYRSVP